MRRIKIMLKKKSKTDECSGRKRDQLNGSEEFQRLRTHFKGLKLLERANGVKAVLDRFPNERLQSCMAALLGVDEKMIRLYKKIGELSREDKEEIEKGESPYVVLEDAQRRAKTSPKKLETVSEPRSAEPDKEQFRQPTQNDQAAELDHSSDGTDLGTATAEKKSDAADIERNRITDGTNPSEQDAPTSEPIAPAKSKVLIQQEEEWRRSEAERNRIRLPELRNKGWF
jgi:hypothetical protein